jgi:hypothetical protein
LSLSFDILQGGLGGKPIVQVEKDDFLDVYNLRVFVNKSEIPSDLAEILPPHKLITEDDAVKLKEDAEKLSGYSVDVWSFEKGGSLSGYDFKKGDIVESTREFKGRKAVILDMYLPQPHIVKISWLDAPNEELNFYKDDLKLSESKNEYSKGGKIESYLIDYKVVNRDGEITYEDTDWQVYASSQTEAKTKAKKQLSERLIDFLEDYDSGKKIGTLKITSMNKFAKGGQTPAQQEKIAFVMGEFKDGNLKTSYGEKVTDRKQAIAIALSEAGVDKKERGGEVEVIDNKIIISDKNGNEYVYLHFIKENSHYLIPYIDTPRISKKYWEHHFIPKNTWIDIDSIDFNDYNITKEQFEEIKDKGLQKQKEILAKYHSSFAKGGILTTKQEKDFIEWMNDGNVVKTGEDEYIEQTTQWKKKFTLDELKRFYKREFLQYANGGEVAYWGGKIDYEGEEFTKELETEDFIYYVDENGEQVLMIRKSDNSVASDNYFAENDLYERMVEIANGREDYIYLRPESLPYLVEYKESFAKGGSIYSLNQIEYNVEYRDSDGDKYSETFETKDKALKAIFDLKQSGHSIISRTRHRKDDGSSLGHFEKGGLVKKSEFTMLGTGLLIGGIVAFFNK